MATVHLLGSHWAQASELGSCEQPGYSAWSAEWISDTDLQAALPQVPSIRTLWMRSLEFDLRKGAFRIVDHPTFQKIREHAGAQVCLGAFFHNAGPLGFDPALGQAILKISDQSLQTLAENAKRQGWKAVQVDIESLPETAAEDYEKFLDRLISKMHPVGIHVSIALHAKTSEPGTFEGARFQRWKILREKDVDFVIMAYDHHWATSEPGPVAPLSWVKSVARYAQSIFPAERLIIALPNYGYAWKKNPKTRQWQGSAKLPSELDKIIHTEKGWKADSKPGAADGQFFRKKNSQFIAYDAIDSIHVKSTELAALGIHRIAIWRIGGPFPKPL